MAFLSLFIAAGTTGFAFSVFLPPMAAELGWPRSTLVFAASTAWLTASLAGPWLGSLIDRHGARLILSAAIVLTGSAVAACGLVNEAWQFYLAFGLMGGVGRAVMQNVAPSAMVANWFLRRRTLAFSFAALGPPASSLVYPGAVAIMVATLGWREAWLWLGASAVVMGLVPALVLIRRRPEDLGLLPDGDADPAEQAASGTTPRQPAAEDNWELREVLHHAGFWAVATGMSLVILTPATITVFLFPYFYDQGMSETVSAVMISVLSLAQVLSRVLFWGPAIARLGGVRPVLLLWGTLILASVLLLQTAHDEATAYLASLALGFAMGGNLVLQLQVWPEYFGRKAVGAVTGTAQMVNGASAAGGPLLVAVLLDATGSYDLPLWFMAGTALAGLVLLAATGKPERKAPIAA